MKNIHINEVITSKLLILLEGLKGSATRLPYPESPLHPLQPQHNARMITGGGRRVGTGGWTSESYARCLFVSLFLFWNRKKAE